MVFRRACCPAFTITTNGGTGILQIVQEILGFFFQREELHSSPISVSSRNAAPKFGLPSTRIGNDRSVCVNRSQKLLDNGESGDYSGPEVALGEVRPDFLQGRFRTVIVLVTILYVTLPTLCWEMSFDQRSD